MVPGQTVHLTIQAVNRQFRFVPQKDVVDSIRFIFWHCVAKYGMAVHDMLWMSNHAHICMTDIQGVLPKFMCQMNSLISRQLNAIRGITGTNIEKGYSSIELADDESMLGYCAYTLANPCAADLVAKASAWKGISTLNLEYDQGFEVKRPKCGLWSEDRPARPRRSRSAQLDEETESGEKKKDAKPRRKPSKLPETVEAKLTRPNIMSSLSDRELRELIRAKTMHRERVATSKRKAKHKHKRKKQRKTTLVLGWQGVLKLRWNQSPRSLRSIFEPEPLVAARSKELLQARLDVIESFRQAYREAREIYITKGRKYATFPVGTWKMRVTYNAQCA